MEKSRGLSYRNDQLNRLNRFFKVLNYLFMFLGLVKVVPTHSKIDRLKFWLWLGVLFSGYLSLIFHKPTFKNSGEVYTENNALKISSSSYKFLDSNSTWYLCLSQTVFCN